ncbi:ATP-binding cassette domain-containing protein [Desulfonema magnum]|uniref:ATP-binding protein Uup n=1 Tax=Desulfonema magnum TaxID=45655 RepID=A0A975BKD5_9BACT|nr:ATP-binding cassette domain-containing protein [Desulfonema magnum]QTA87172.1 putative ABC transporter, ATP-binding protein [Desulfonema magnum]
MALLSMKDVSVAFGGPLLLDKVNLQIEHGERVCLLGRNGAGKSTLMKLISEDVLPDQGEIIRHQRLRIGHLAQEVPSQPGATIFDVVAGGLENLNNIPDTEEWEIHRQAEQVLSRMKLNADAEFEVLSAGLKRRVLLARALACDPEILLLDEPTNHLDIDAIIWMEDFLLRHVKTLLFVTHDRMLLKKLATRIIELDRGNLTSWPCDYDTYLKRKQADTETEENQRAAFDKKLAKEEIWRRNGLKARRTRNEGRVRALEKMREIRRARTERTGNVRMQAQEAERSGKLVIEAKHVSYDYEEQPIIRDFSTTVMRGDKVGFIGPNGSGKTTLLQILLDNLSPQQGNVRHGTRLEVAYFDQLRSQLNEDKTVEENVGDGNDKVIINGNPRHIIGYLKDFLFTPDRARSPVRILSGGERNRLLLAKLFTKPSNVLVLDEPTNDLDAETLELLEELLLDYSGTLLLVSHDREFLNNVVTSTLVFEGQGQVSEYVGGYDDWLRQHKPDSPMKIKKAAPKQEKPKVPPGRPHKLGFKEQRELEHLPLHIEKMEAEQQELYEIMADPGFYQQNGENVANAKEKLETLEKELEQAYERWEHLEGMEN